MGALEDFLTYANAFEETYLDDDWQRLEEYFAANATYTIVAEKYGCVLQGPSDILAGMKRSLDNFDRRFDSREIKVGDDLAADEHGLSVSWIAHYQKAGLPDYQLHGHSKAQLANGKITALTDSFSAESEASLEQWVAETGFEVNPAYL